MVYAVYPLRACTMQRDAHMLAGSARASARTPIAVRAVPYITGTAGSNACSMGSKEIVNPTACQIAAVAVGATWGGSSENASRPKGCYLSSAQTVSFNTHATGSGAAGYTPLCAGDSGTPAFIALRIGSASYRVSAALCGPPRLYSTACLPADAARPRGMARACAFVQLRRPSPPQAWPPREAR